MRSVFISGLGYVGQTLAVVLAEAGFRVYGIDVNEMIFEALRNKRSHIHEKDMDFYIKKHIGKNIFFGKPEEIYGKHEADTYIVCVPTPVDPETKKPDMRSIISVMNEISQHLKVGQTVILRSTVPVGTTRNLVKPILERNGMKAGRDFRLVYAPERTVQGIAIQELKSLPQIIGGIDKESSERAVSIFSEVTPTVITVSSPEAAEMVKLIDNSYRDLRFAFANEISGYCSKLGIETSEIIRAANEGYARNNIPVPGLVGGICLNKDPHILFDCAKNSGYEMMLVKDARQINESMPARIAERLQKHGLEGKKVLIAGIAFKGFPETNDIRESQAVKLIGMLNGQSEILCFDPIVESCKIEGLGAKNMKSLEEGIRAADIVVFMNNHPEFQKVETLEKLRFMKKGAVLFDAWGLFSKRNIEELGVTYEGL